MADEEKKIENGSREAPSPKILQVDAEPKEVVEKKERATDRDVAALKEAIEKTDIDDSLKLQAAHHARSLQGINMQEQIKKLLDIAAVKGVAYAIHVAKKTGDAFVVDALHDALAENSLYKKFKV